MQQLVNINGYETVIEFEDGSLPESITHTGSTSEYTIDYGNGLTEVGGTLEIQAQPITDSVIEGVKVVKLPFTTIYTFQATAINTIRDPEQLNSESVFIAPTFNGYKVYATANSTSTNTILVQWSAKGVI